MTSGQLLLVACVTDSLRLETCRLLFEGRRAGLGREDQVEAGDKRGKRLNFTFTVAGPASNRMYISRGTAVLIPREKGSFYPAHRDRLRDQNRKRHGDVY